MTLVIGHIALIQRTKKQDFVLGAMEQLKKEGFDVVGLFAGEVREPDYLEELTRMAAEKGLGDRAVFLGRRNDIPDLLQVMDLLMIPSSFEGFPLAGLEAAAAGVPVAACDVAGAEEFVRVSGGGVTFREGDAAGGAEAVKEILRHRERFRRAGMAFAGEMSAQLYAGRLKSIFDAVR